MIRLRDSQTGNLVYLAKNLIDTVRIICLTDDEVPYIIQVNKTLQAEQQFATEADAIDYVASNILDNENS